MITYKFTAIYGAAQLELETTAPSHVIASRLFRKMIWQLFRHGVGYQLNYTSKRCLATSYSYIEQAYDPIVHVDALVHTSSLHIADMELKGLISKLFRSKQASEYMYPVTANGYTTAVREKTVHLDCRGWDWGIVPMEFSVDLGTF